MKTAKTVVAVMVGLLSLLAGAAKVAQVPEEVAFLGQLGFGAPLIVAFGALQVVGGLLMIIPKTRFYGALLAAAGFTISVVLLLLAGNLPFAGVSIVPVALAAWVAYERRPVASG